MPRSIVIGNGSLLATFDERLQMRDFYYPYVGMEDHTKYGHAHRVGLMVDGRGFAWFSDHSWQIMPKYRDETLLSNSHMRNDKLGVEIISRDFVHPIHNIVIRDFVIKTIHDEQLSVRMFFNHDFHIYGDKQKDTAFYEPHTNSVIHYRQTRYFLVGGRCDRPVQCHAGLPAGKYDSILKELKKFKTCGISSFALGKTGYNGLEGTWKDAEDGILHENPIEQGSVDSTVAFHGTVKNNDETHVTMWLCAGKSLEETLNLQQIILEETPERLERNCHNYWKSWVNKTDRSFGGLSDAHVSLYKRSLLLIRLHCDNGGGILAAADADIMAFNKDTYTYVWPRDGAFVSMALDKAGYGEVTRRFYEFCRKIQLPDGYVLHKYNPDGSLGSSWHPWFKNGEAQLPIQEDETALVIYGLYKHFEAIQDFEFLQNMYESFVKKAAQFLVDFTEDESGLPLASYDPWEEQRGVFTYTTACTIAGLEAAARISHILGHFKHSERYQEAADKMKQAMLFHLFDEEAQRFVKKIERKDGKTIASDPTPDISISVIWKLGVLSKDDPRVVSTMEQILTMITVRTDVGGLTRYANDYYHSCVPPTADIPGNPWILTTLWGAQWRMVKAKTLEELERTKSVFDWVLKHSKETGILPEQLNPITGEHLSVAPLTWSHATYVESVLLYLEREHELKRS